MGGKTVTFSFADASPDHVWLAAVQAVSSLGYTVGHSDRESRMLSFNTGRSMSSMAGQDLTMTLAVARSGTRMTMGGSLAKGGNPFGGGSQMFSWGEKGRLIERFAATVKQQLPRIAEPAMSTRNGDGDIASQIERLVSMRDGGVLSEAEFIAAKAKLLGDS